MNERIFTERWMNAYNMVKFAPTLAHGVAGLIRDVMTDIPDLFAHDEPDALDFAHESVDYLNELIFMLTSARDVLNALANETQKELQR